MGHLVAQPGSIRCGAAAAETATHALQTRIMVLCDEIRMQDLSFRLLSSPILDQGCIWRSVGSPAKRRWDVCTYILGGRKAVGLVDKVVEG
jgi:hypothetical protein